MSAESKPPDASMNAARQICDAAWDELKRSPYVQSRLGAAGERLPDVSFSEAERRSKVGRALLKQLQPLDLAALPHDIELTLRLVRFRARVWAREAEWYWTVIDPTGVGWFGLFLPTAYCGGHLLNLSKGRFSAFAFAESGDCDRYLALVSDYARLIDQFTERTEGQANRGIRMPKVQVRQARTLLDRFKLSVRDTIEVAAERMTSVTPGDFAREVEQRIATLVEPAFERALNGLSDTYLERAPDRVGLDQYPGGAVLYSELVKQQTTLELTPEEMHERGLERMSEIEASIQSIGAELGFTGDAAAFAAHMSQDLSWRADTVEGVTSVFQRYIDRLEPQLPRFFWTAPRAPYGVAPLPEALQGSMTYGYYDAPRSDRAKGLYIFNSANLTKQPLFSLATLTYHELVPGHHMHFATQQENPDLHPFRTHSFVNAYVEGWAEYAATLAGEIGMYEQPQERYGRLVMDAFLTSRLVVDTGMNGLGWSLERARDYMRTHSRLTEREILTESVRYSCDIPAQALAYKLGDTQILAMRQRMRRTLGERFDIRDFHAAVLGPGALPLPDLEWHVDHETKRLLSRDCCNSS